MSHLHHAIDYIEINVTDMEAAKRFYAEAFSFPGGRRFQFLDPSGHELAVWSEE